MDIGIEDIKKFVDTVEELAGSAFELDLGSLYMTEDLDYFHHKLWLILEHYFGISPNDMKAKYRIEKV